LESIIIELAAEDTVGGNPVTVFKDKRADPAQETADELELFSYFLNFQSLPPWSGDISRQALYGLFAGLLKRVPVNMNLLIRQAGQSPEVRTFLVRNFSEEILREIVEILQPGEGEFIADYVTEVKQVNQK